MTEGYPTATVDGREVPYDPSTLRRIQEHPCFSEKACHAFGRMHLAVAPKCNIQCNYCQRDYDCVNESRPGVTSRIVTPEEAVALVKQVLDEHKFIKVIGIAGPGDPLANEQTFEALRLVKEHFPETIRCISTNGLMLPERIDETRGPRRRQHHGHDERARPRGRREDLRPHRLPREALRRASRPRRS